MGKIIFEISDSVLKSVAVPAFLSFNKHSEDFKKAFKYLKIYSVNTDSNSNLILESTNGHILVRYTINNQLDVLENEVDMLIDIEEIQSFLRKRNIQYYISYKDGENKFIAIDTNKINKDVTNFDNKKLNIDSREFPDTSNLFPNEKELKELENSKNASNLFSFDLSYLNELYKSLNYLYKYHYVYFYMKNNDEQIYVRSMNGEWEAIIMPLKINR